MNEDNKINRGMNQNQLEEIKRGGWGGWSQGLKNPYRSSKMNDRDIYLTPNTITPIPPPFLITSFDSFQ